MCLHRLIWCIGRCMFLLRIGQEMRMTGILYHCKGLPWTCLDPAPQKESKVEHSSLHPRRRLHPQAKEKLRPPMSQHGCNNPFCQTRCTWARETRGRWDNNSLDAHGCRHNPPHRQAQRRFQQQERRARHGQEGGQLGRKWRKEWMQDAVKGRNLTG